MLGLEGAVALSVIDRAKLRWRAQPPLLHYIPRRDNAVFAATNSANASYSLLIRKTLALNMASLPSTPRWPVEHPEIPDLSDTEEFGELVRKLSL